MKTTKTTIYVLNNKEIDTVSFLIDAISEYALHHLDKLEECKRITAQIIHCRDNFTEVYTLE